MPVRKFRSVEEMNVPHWRDPGDPDLLRAIRDLWEIGRRMRARHYPRGVKRYPSIEAMHAAQEQWADRSHA